jgi:hypothetical protein
MDTSHNALVFRIAGIGALIAFVANVLDVALGFGGSEVVTYGTKSALEWFALYQQSWFKGIYALGILNIAYMTAMLPVYLGLVLSHLKKHGIWAILAMTVFLIAMAAYIATNAAIPMYVLSTKYALATTEIQKNIYLSAGEAVLARGEDFTPGSFFNLFLGGLAAISISVIMLRGGVFGKVNAWIGIIGFTFLSSFTFLATFVPPLYNFAFYVFGSLGGILALIWFILTARRFFQLSH